MGLLDGIRRIDEIDLEHARVLIRADLDVPIEGDEVVDDTRIRQALPTIQLAVEKGARVVVASHLGSPQRPDSRFLSLEPVGVRLSQLTGWEVHFPEECVGDAPRKLVADLRPGQILLLENLRSDPGEEADDEQFARQLSDLCDVYVNDAFRLCDRRLASVHALPRVMRERAAGLLLRQELEIFDALMTRPARRYVAVIGSTPMLSSAAAPASQRAGARDAKQGPGGRESKQGHTGLLDVGEGLALVEVLLSRVDAVVLGGALANTFLAAQGHAVNPEVMAPDKLALARTLLEKARAAKVEVLLPCDFMVAGAPRAGRSGEGAGRAERAGRDSERAGRDSERAGRDGERPGRDGERPGRDSERAGRDGERAGRTESAGAAPVRDAESRECVPLAALARDQMPYDIGPRTIELYLRALASAKTVFWSGPMGTGATGTGRLETTAGRLGGGPGPMSSQEQLALSAFGKGTEEVARAIAAQKDALTIAAGEETTRALCALGQLDAEIVKGFKLVATGGRAALTAMMGKRLPGLDALRGG